MGQKIKLKSLVNLWLPVVFWCGVLFYLSSLPAPPPSGNFFLDFVLPYLAHFGEFFILFVLVYRASKNFFSSLLLVFLYAFSDEFHQSFVPTRTPSLSDVLVDSLGAIAALILIKYFLPKAPKQIKIWAQRLFLT